tara:strand:+ start:103 stop:1434 length:1332 start_codon:yes stop_codon:yes gene_type:complete
MANLVELSQMAEDMPDEQLIQSTQGQGNLPPFVAITEIKRRTDLRKAYEAQQPKPQASVAEELVAEFAGSPSGLGAMAQSPDLQQAFPSGDMGNMAPPSPMQMMASGGRTGYQAGTYGGYNLDAYSSTPNKVEEQIQSTLNNPMLDNLTEEEKIKLFGKSGILFDPYNPVDYILALSGVGKLGQIGFKGLKALKAKGAFQPKIVKETKLPDIKVKGGGKKPGGVMVETTQEAGKLRGLVDNPITRNPFTFGLGSAYVLGKGQQFFGASSENERLRKELNDLRAKQAANTKTNEQDVSLKVEEDSDKGLTKLREFATSPDNADLLIGLGGAISSAKNIGELGSGISDAYRGVMADRAAVKQAGLQGRLLEAQISKIELEVANMPLNIAIKQYESLNDLVDSGVLTAEEAKIREIALSKRIQKLQGITANQKSERDELLGLTKVV